MQQKAGLKSATSWLTNTSAVIDSQALTPKNKLFGEARGSTFMTDGIPQYSTKQ